jgi:hypothetical protein
MLVVPLIALSCCLICLHTEKEREREKKMDANYALVLLNIVLQFGCLWLKYQERIEQQEKHKTDMVVKNLKLALPDMTVDREAVKRLFIEYELKQEQQCSANPQECYTENS